MGPTGSRATESKYVGNYNGIEQKINRTLYKQQAFQPQTPGLRPASLWQGGHPRLERRQRQVWSKRRESVWPKEVRRVGQECQRSGTEANSLDIKSPDKITSAVLLSRRQQSQGISSGNSGRWNNKYCNLIFKFFWLHKIVLNSKLFSSGPDHYPK